MIVDNRPYTDNFHTFCNPYFEKTIIDIAFWDDRFLDN